MQIEYGRPPKMPRGSPKSQLESKSEWNKVRNQTCADFFTIGYSGRSRWQFVSALSGLGIQTLVDIRFTPISRFKPEFNGTGLSQFLLKMGIRYVHRPDLGVPKDIRQEAEETGSLEGIWIWYDSNVVARFANNLDNFFNFADHPVALMCTEYDPQSCHRHRLALALESRGLRSYDL